MQNFEFPCHIFPYNTRKFSHSTRSPKISTYIMRYVLSNIEFLVCEDATSNFRFKNSTNIQVLKLTVDKNAFEDVAGGHRMHHRMHHRIYHRMYHRT